MRAINLAKTGLVLAAICLILATGTAVAGTASGEPGPEAVTVGDATQSLRDGTLSGLSIRYMPPDTQSKGISDLSRNEQHQMWRNALAVQVYHNALAGHKHDGRVIENEDLIYPGEKIYMPPKAVIDRILELMPASPGEPVSAAKRDQLMHVVLSDVAENQDVIKQSKTGDNLSDEVLRDAEAVRQLETASDANLNGVGDEILEGLQQGQDLEDEPPGADETLLDEDGKPIPQEDDDDAPDGEDGDGKGDGSDDSRSDEEESQQDSDRSFYTMTAAQLEGEREMGLRAVLPLLERQANDPNNPLRDKARSAAARIKAELSRRDKLKGEKNNPEAGDTGKGDKPRADQDGGKPPVRENQDDATETESDDRLAGSGGIDTESEYFEDTDGSVEYVPDWYLRALQEWNLQQYWQSNDKDQERVPKGGKKIYDPLTGETRTSLDYDDPFDEFSDELTNRREGQGTVQKLED